MKKMLLIGAFLFGGVNLCSIENMSVEYKLSRLDLACIEKSYVESEQQKSIMRTVKKYATAGAVLVTAMLLLKAQGHLFPTRAFNKSACLAVDPEVSSEDAGILKRLAQDIVATGKGFGKWVIGAVPGFIGGLVLQKGSSVFTNTFGYYRRVETVHGFVELNTHVYDILKVLETTAVPYDIYSNRLSTDINFGEHKFLVQKFVNDASDLIAQDSDSMRFYLAQMLRRDYSERNTELINLQNYAMQAMGPQQMNINDLLVHMKMVDRADRTTMTELMNILVDDVQRVLAFVKVKNLDNEYNQKLLQDHVKVFILAVNSFLDRIERLLNSDVEDMYAASHRNQGLFDTIYEMKQFLRKMFKTFSSSMKIYA